MLRGCVEDMLGPSKIVFETCASECASECVRGYVYERVYQRVC